MSEPTQADRAFLEALAGSIGGREDTDRLSEFRTEKGERAKRRCSRYGWAIYHRVGPTWAITPAGRTALASTKGQSDE